MPVLAAANDLGGPGINGGVLLLNVSGFLPLLRPMLAYSEGRRFHFGLNEQTMLNHFLGAPDGKKINRLPAIYNGRPSERCRHARDPSPNEPCSTGTSPSLSKFHERSPPLCADVAVWHFQGAKEWRFHCFFDALDAATNMESLGYNARGAPFSLDDLQASYLHASTAAAAAAATTAASSSRPLERRRPYRTGLAVLDDAARSPSLRRSEEEYAKQRCTMIRNATAHVSYKPSPVMALAGRLNTRSCDACWLVKYAALLAFTRALNE